MIFLLYNTGPDSDERFTSLCICGTSSCPNCQGNLTVHSFKRNIKEEELLDILEMSGQVLKI